jgi:hypothetical protein
MKTCKECLFWDKNKCKKIKQWSENIASDDHEKITQWSENTSTDD